MTPEELATFEKKDKEFAAIFETFSDVYEKLVNLDIKMYTDPKDVIDVGHVEKITLDVAHAIDEVYAFVEREPEHVRIFSETHRDIYGRLMDSLGSATSRVMISSAWCYLISLGSNDNRIESLVRAMLINN